MSEENAVEAKTTKPPKTHKCKSCTKEFPGTGKRGRPFDLCPECRAVKAK